MSCDVAAAVASIWLASLSPTAQTDAPLLHRIAVMAPVAPPSVAREPLFVDIVKRAEALRAETEAYQKAAGSDGAAKPLAGFAGYTARINELAKLDEAGREFLIAKGREDDLKCILHGIAVDMPLKLKDIQGAATAKAQDLALREMIFLLRDNIEVITAPPQPAA